MEEKKLNSETREKMTYEQLENAAHQLSEQSKNLYMQNQKLLKTIEEMENSNFFRRLDYLWNIIHSDSEYISRDFKIKCGEEFMKLMTPEKEEPETES